MKKLIIALLLLAATATSFAQYWQYMFDENISPYWEYRYRFRLNNNNRITLIMQHPQQLQYINLDSLFQVVLKQLRPLKDSFATNEGTTKVVLHPNNKELAFKHYNKTLKTYSYSGETLVETKTDQDTLLIRSYLPRHSEKDSNRRSWPFFIAMTLNNISDVFNLPDKTLSICVDQLYQFYPSLKGTARKEPQPKEVFIDVVQNRNEPILENKKKSYQSYPYLQFGLQYGRGTTIPSAAAGWQYIKINRHHNTSNAFRLIWEPYFFFSRDAQNRLRTDRNDFITFKYNEWDNNNMFDQSKKLAFYMNMSVGYLVGRRGNWFEENTFKFAFPGLHYNSLVLEPEFFFNKAFRNFSPSLKLTYFFE